MSDSSFVSSDRVLRSVELAFRSRLDGVGPGRHRSIRLGEGIEFADMREYVPGDDVRTIDWNVTARTGTPHVRIYEADREATALMVVDRSASMLFGTAQRTKEALLRELVAAISVALLRRGDRIGGLVFTDTPAGGLPPMKGRAAALRLLNLIQQHPPVEGAQSRLDMAIEEAGRVARRRSIIVIVSDWLDAGSWQPALRKLAMRHEVIAAEIRDPRESELPDVGAITLEDPETGRQMHVETTPKLRAAFAEAAENLRRSRTLAIAASGAAHLVVSTDRDWLADLLKFLQSRRGSRR